MGCRRLGWALLLSLCWFGWALPARADEPKLLAASLLYESPTLIVPVLLFVLRTESEAELRVGQTGWTTSAFFRQVLEPRLTFVAGAELTPLYAHSSNRVFVGGEPAPFAEWRDTALQLAAGFAVRDPDWLQLEWRALLLKEWVSGAPLSAAEQAFWRKPFGGVQIALGTSQVRSDDPFRARWDGAKLWITGQGFSNGSFVWGRARVHVGMGRKLGPLYVNAYASGFLVSTSNIVARELVGGAWDDLQGWALHGHPHGEFRAQHGVVGHLALDWEITRHWELGARGAVFHSDRDDAHGQALLTRVSVAGVQCTLGLATPDADAFRGHLGTLRVFASISSAVWLF